MERIQIEEDKTFKGKVENKKKKEENARFLRIVSNFLRPSFERTKLSSLIDGGAVEMSEYVGK